MASKNQLYSEASIRVLKGLEPVKQRPGMYTRTDHPLHIIQEVLDNAADEALAGQCKNIYVTQHSDGSISVEDDGRGIPVGLHPDEQVPVVEIVFTRLHAGGKFDKASGGAYSFSGGLHGVGVSVTNALSKRLEVTVWREGGEHSVVFQDGEVVQALKSKPMLKAERAPGERVRSEKHTGTRVRSWPNPKYFDAAVFPVAELHHLLRAKAVLLGGLQVHYCDEKSGKTLSWQFKEGLRSYLQESLIASGASDPIIPLFEGEQYMDAHHDTFAEGEGVQWVVAFSEEGALLRESYVNLISTSAGGTHEAGLRDGLFGAVKSFVEIHNLLPKGVKLLPEDVFARASFVLSAKVLDPQFQGQVKERLNSRDALRLVSNLTKPVLELWLNQHVDYGKRLADLVIRQAQARSRALQKVEKKKSSGVAVLPGKLTDCESSDIGRNEVFLVEGDSAGGSAKMGRDKEFQAILPLRGKVLNSWETIGVDPHGPNDAPNLTQLRYGRICILSDADVDGSHIQVLLLTLFYKHFPKLVELGHIYIAKPPLFRVDVPAQGKRPLRKIYCLDEGELKHVEDKLRKEGVREGLWSISRFKGLGEMNAEQLWETTMNPETRRFLQVGFAAIGAEATNERFDMLMGRNEASSRRTWLERRGNEAEVDV
jgi:topoisomerase IV subunit B